MRRETCGTAAAESDGGEKIEVEEMTMEELATELLAMVVRQTEARKIVETMDVARFAELSRMVRAGLWPETNL